MPMITINWDSCIHCGACAEICYARDVFEMNEVGPHVIHPEKCRLCGHCLAVCTTDSIDHEEILNRSAAVFAELQSKLGDYLTGQDAFPTSEELGLDIVESLIQSKDRRLNSSPTNSVAKLSAANRHPVFPGEVNSPPEPV